MPAPHDQTLRDRVVAAYERGVGSFATVAEIFGVGEASVNRWVNEARREGRAVPKPMGGARRSRVVDDEGEEFLRKQIKERPNSTQAELAAAFKVKFGVEISRRTIGKALARMGMTKKKHGEGHSRRNAQTSLSGGNSG